MAVKLRLTRRGKKKQPFYRIVATDSRVKRDGKYIEKIGHYNPLTEPAEIVIDEERVFYWLQNGAIPTDTVKNLLTKKGIWMRWALMKQGADEKKIDEEFKKWEVLQLERQKRLEALKAQEAREQEKKEEVEEVAAEADPESAETVETETAETETVPEAESVDTAQVEDAAKEEEADTAEAPAE